MSLFSAFNALICPDFDIYIQTAMGIKRMVVSSRILRKKKGVGGQERFEEAIGTFISSVSFVFKL